MSGVTYGPVRYYNSSGRLITAEERERDVVAWCEQNLAAGRKAGAAKDEKAITSAENHLDNARSTEGSAVAALNDEAKAVNILRTTSGTILAVVKITATVATDGLAGGLIGTGVSAGADVLGGKPEEAVLTTYTGVTDTLAEEARNELIGPLGAPLANGGLILEGGGRLIKPLDLINTAKGAFDVETVPLTDPSVTAENLEDYLNDLKPGELNPNLFEKGLGYVADAPAPTQEDFVRLIKSAIDAKKKAEEALARYGAAIDRKYKNQDAAEEAEAVCVRKELTPNWK